MKKLIIKMKEKITNSKIAKWISDVKNRIGNSKISSKTKETVENINNNANNNIKQQTDGTAFSEVVRNIYGRFSKFFSGFSKKFKKFINFENLKDGDKVSSFSYYMRKIIRGICILLTIAFIALVIYAIKDVFIQVLLAISTTAAIVVCVEFIMTVLSVATGKAI